MRAWMDHIVRYSRRDQLSSRYILADFDRLATFDLDNLKSDWHHWVGERQTGRNVGMRVNSYKSSVRAPLATLADTRTTITASKPSSTNPRGPRRNRLTRHPPRRTHREAQGPRRPPTGTRGHPPQAGSATAAPERRTRGEAGTHPHRPRPPGGRRSPARSGPRALGGSADHLGCSFTGSGHSAAASAQDSWTKLRVCTPRDTEQLIWSRVPYVSRSKRFLDVGRSDNWSSI